VFAHFASTVGSQPYGGIGIALWIGAGLAVAGAAFAVFLYWIRGARPETPQIEQFLAGEAPAYYSPPLFGPLPQRIAEAPTTEAGEDAQPEEQIAEVHS
jgi:hypothetical protein